MSASPSGHTVVEWRRRSSGRLLNTPRGKWMAALRRLGAVLLRLVLTLVIALPAVLLVLVAGRASPVSAANQTVTTSADSGPGSLRAAIHDAGSNETIDFAP